MYIIIIIFFLGVCHPSLLGPITSMIWREKQRPPFAPLRPR